MITPTRTVCYAEFEYSKTRHKVLSDEGSGLKIEVDSRFNIIEVWPYGHFSRIIVREEPIEQYHPGEWLEVPAPKTLSSAHQFRWER